VGGGKARFGICFAPSEASDQAVAKKAGWLAEALIMKNYLTATKAAPMVTDWFDVLTAVPGLPAPTPLDNPVAFFNFLKRHHPHLAALGNAWNDEFRGGRTAVPDILTAKPQVREYYEIKPGSITGVAAGKAKLAKLSTLFQGPKFGLQMYKGGTTYTPGAKDDVDLSKIVSVPPVMNLWAGRLGIKKISFTLRFRRDKSTPGLILYWFCLDMEADEDTEEEVIENVARWYTIHVVHSMRTGNVLTENDVRPELEFAFDVPAASRLVPADEAIRTAILSAGPAREYDMIAGQAGMNLLNEMTRIEAEQQIERIKQMYRVGVPGIPQMYRQPTAINQGGFDYRSRDRAIATVSMVGNAVVVTVAVAATVAIVVASAGAAAPAPALLGGEAATGAAAGAGAGSATAGSATAGSATLTTTVFASSAAAEAGGGVEMVSQSTLQAARVMAQSETAKQVALHAGALLVVGVSRDAVASTGVRAAPVPSVAGLENVRLVPSRGTPSSGTRIGRIRLKGITDEDLQLDPSRPPAD
jgi:hypothetical protein